MGKKSQFVFDIYAWRHPYIQMLPPGAKGLLIEIICWEFLSKEPYLTGTRDALARMCGCPRTEEFNALLDELHRQKCVEIEDRNGVLKITAIAIEAQEPRRYIEAEARRELRAKPCAICGSTERIEIDHVKPFSRGGSNHRRNLQPLCHDCNMVKRDRRMTHAQVRERRGLNAQ